MAQAPTTGMVRTTSASPQVETNTNAFGTGKVERRSGGFERLKDRYGPAKPDPWLQMKLAVLILLALTIWSFYVVVGRVCTPMIRNSSNTGLGRGAGVGTMIGYVILWLLYVWSYMKMLFTGPGFARNYVPKCSPPPDNPPQTQAFSPPARGMVGPEAHGPNDHMMAAPHPQLPHHQESAAQRNMNAAAQANQPGQLDPECPDPSELAPIQNLLPIPDRDSPSNNPSSASTLTPDSPTRFIQPGMTKEDTSSKKKGRSRGSKLKDPSEVQRPIPLVQFGPRWCRFCEINKPDRTHHCRHCGTCIMQFDHHCMWIGQCVGWANHKLFIIFNFWAMLFCAYIFIVLIVITAKSGEIDGQVVGLIAASGLFGMFTCMMLPSHLYLIFKGISTIESYSSRTQKEKEASILQAEYGYLWHNQMKKKVEKRWKEEWGGVDVDERWKWGTWLQMWEQEMGKSKIGWILPIGRPLGDGMHYQQNPRFGRNGEWLPKKDWPKELQS